MKINQLLLSEYKQKGLEPVYCRVGTDKIIVPQSYNGNIDNFIDDIFAYEAETIKYIKYNESQTAEKDKLDVHMVNCGDISFLPPFDLYIKQLSSQEIITRSTRRALRRYRSTIKKTMRAQKEYPNKTFAVSMEADYITELDSLHKKYVINKIGYNLAKTCRWSVNQTVNIIAGAAGALPLAAYYMLDKKVHFADNRGHGFIKENVAPYIRKGLIKGLVPLLAGASLSLRAKSSENHNNSNPAQTTETLSQDRINIEEANPKLTQRFVINERADFNRLFEISMPYIAQSMMPTEVLILNPYSDNGTINNTLGLGSYYMPKDGNPKTKDWIKTSKYVKQHGNVSITGQKAYELARGWFESRDGGRICRDLYTKLKGAELTIGEFTAICTCMYNDEKNGKKLCEFVRDNYKDPVKCAAYLMQLKPGNEKFNDGILKRHAHEALTYLNLNNYCDKVPYFLVKEGINSKGKKYYVTSVTQLTPEICEKMSNDLNHNRLDGAIEVAQSVYNYHCKNGQTVYQIGKTNGLSFLFDGETPLDFSEIAHISKADSIYKEALKYYSNEQYVEAVSGFKKMIEQGYNSADIHNDLAITYYKMGKYQDCIDECRQVLATGETEQYAPANYNAGKAYEALDKTDKALENYKMSLQREPENKAYQSAVKRLEQRVKSTQTLPRRSKTH